MKSMHPFKSYILLDSNTYTSLKIFSTGLLFNLLGRAPRKWDTVDVPGYELSAADVSGTRVTQVRVRECPDENEGTQAGE